MSSLIKKVLIIGQPQNSRTRISFKCKVISIQNFRNVYGSFVYLGIISEAMQHFKSWNGSCNRFGYYGNDIKGDLWVIVVSLLK